MLAEVTPQALQVLAQLAPSEYIDMFRVARVRNPQPQRLAVIGCLFRPKNAPTNWAERYLTGLANFSKVHMRGFKGFKLVIYLDPALEDETIPWFADIEFRIMQQSSEDHSPGAAWRLLALSDPTLDVAVITDIDQMQPILPLLKDAMLESDKTAVVRLFRGRQETRENGHGHLPYVPLWAGETVVRPPLLTELGSMQELLPGFLLFCKLAGQPGCEYGFDERFLGHVVYWFAVHRHIMRTAVEPGLMTQISEPALHDFSISMNAIPVVNE